MKKNFQSKVFSTKNSVTRWDAKEINQFNSKNNNKTIIHNVNNKNGITSMIIKI